MKMAETAIRHGVALMLLAGSLVEAAPADDTRKPEQLRARIQAESTRIEAMFSVDMDACQQRFAVTACVEQARQRRRDALAAPRSQALVLDDIDRRERAVARREAITIKQREAASRAAPPLPASAALTRVQPSPSAASTAVRRSHSTAASDTAAEALRRAHATRERQAEIETTQQRIRARQIDRLRAGKVAAPLPEPAASR